MKRAFFIGSQRRDHWPIRLRRRLKGGAKKRDRAARRIRVNQPIKIRQSHCRWESSQRLLVFLTRLPDCQDESSQSCFRPSQRRFFPCEGDFGVMTEQTSSIRPRDQKHASVLSCFPESCFQLPTRAKPRVQVHLGVTGKKNKSP